MTPLPEASIRGDRPIAPETRAIPGPLLAVCALCGGAGASTLAHLVARSAVVAMDGPVLVCDTGGPTGGLGAYAGVDASRSLPALTHAVASGRALGEPIFVEPAPGLRVLASRPQVMDEFDEGGLARLLGDARAAHALTVVDCGTPQGELELSVLAAATHIAWVLPATGAGLRRGARVLSLFESLAGPREIVVARHDRDERRAPLTMLSRLAESRRAPLIQLPHVPDLAEHPVVQAIDIMSVSLDAIRLTLRA